MAGVVDLGELLQLVGAIVLKVYESVLTCDDRVFLWASLFYSCCMTGNKQGSIALAGDEAQIGLDAETEDDEAIARNLQAQDRNWRA